MENERIPQDNKDEMRDLKRTLQGLITVYVLLITVIYYFYEKFHLPTQPDSITIYLEYISIIALFLVFYSIIGLINPPKIHCAVLTKLFELTYLLIGLSLLVIALISTGKIIPYLPVKGYFLIILLALIYPAIISVGYPLYLALIRIQSLLNKEKLLKLYDEVYMKERLISILEFILNIIMPTVAVIWLAGSLIEIAKMNSVNYAPFIEYAKISLTLFGFTLVGAVFEEKKKKSKIIKKLFHYSIVFLSSAIGFFILYSISFIPFENGKFFFDYLMPVIIFISMCAGYLGLVYGSIGLLNQLIAYSKKV